MKRREETMTAEKGRGEEIRDGAIRGEKRRGETRRERREVGENGWDGRGRIYQENSGDPCITVSVANVRRNSPPSDSDRGRFSPYVSNFE